MRNSQNHPAKEKRALAILLGTLEAEYNWLTAIHNFFPNRWIPVLELDGAWLKPEPWLELVQGDLASALIFLKVFSWCFKLTIKECSAEEYNNCSQQPIAQGLLVVH